jgi:photosystem II stability/assembly factor-like uncharacterized protein
MASSIRGLSMNQFKNNNTLNCIVIALFFVFSEPILATWDLQLDNGIFYVSAIDACDSQNAIAVTSPSYIYKTTNNGDEWVQLQMAGIDTLYNNLVDVSMPDPNHIWAVTFPKTTILASRDGGLSWDVQFNDSTLISGFNYIEMFDSLNGVSMGNGNSNQPAVFLTTHNGGETWTPHQQEGMPNGSYHAWKPVDFLNSQVGYFYKNLGHNFEIWKTINGCETWVQQNFDSSMVFPVLKFYNENIGALIGSHNILRTENGGNDWTQQTLTEYDSTSSSYDWVADIEFSPVNPSAFWVGVEENLLYTSNAGLTFDTVLVSTTGGILDIVISDVNNGWVLTYWGIYHTSDGGALSTDVKTSVLKEFYLSQNYPNPFNPTTMISYRLPQEAYVSLIIYDISGRVVNILHSGLKQAGLYNYQWNGLDDSGQFVPTGVYLAQMQTSNYSKTIKMVYLK